MQAHNSVAVEIRVTLTLNYSDRIFPFPHPHKRDTKVVWFRSGWRLSLKNGILSNLVLSLKSDLKPH